MFIHSTFGMNKSFDVLNKMVIATIENVTFNIMWSKKLTKTRLKIKENNNVQLSTHLLVNENVENIIMSILQDPNSFVDANKQLWIAGKRKGSGGFSTVYDCKNYPNGVIKYVKKYTNDESRIYMDLGTSPLVPEMLGYGTKNGWEFIVLSKYKWDLQSFLSHRFPDRKTVLNIIVNVLQSLQYIHTKGYIHCDIKLKNIFVDANNTAVLGDFGLSKPIIQSEKPTSRGGTLIYMSTDIHDRKYPTRRSDLESFGWMLIELFGGVLPWRKNSNISEIGTCKILAKSNIDNFMKSCQFNNDDTNSLRLYLSIVWNIEYNEEPDYEKLTKTFEY